MDKLVIDGKIGSLEKVRKESTDGVEEKGKIRISTEDGSVTVG